MRFALRGAEGVAPYGIVYFGGEEIIRKGKTARTKAGAGYEWVDAEVIC